MYSIMSEAFRMKNNLMSKMVCMGIALCFLAMVPGSAVASVPTWDGTEEWGMGWSQDLTAPLQGMIDLFKPMLAEEDVSLDATVESNIGFFQTMRVTNVGADTYDLNVQIGGGFRLGIDVDARWTEEDWEFDWETYEEELVGTYNLQVKGQGYVAITVDMDADVTLTKDELAIEAVSVTLEANLKAGFKGTHPSFDEPSESQVSDIAIDATAIVSLDLSFDPPVDIWDNADPAGMYNGKMWDIYTVVTASGSASFSFDATGLPPDATEDPYSPFYGETFPINHVETLPSMQQEMSFQMECIGTQNINTPWGIKEIYKVVPVGMEELFGFFGQDMGEDPFYAPYSIGDDPMVFQYSPDDGMMLGMEMNPGAAISGWNLGESMPFDPSMMLGAAPPMTMTPMTAAEAESSMTSIQNDIASNPQPLAPPASDVGGGIFGLDMMTFMLIIVILVVVIVVAVALAMKKKGKADAMPMQQPMQAPPQYYAPPPPGTVPPQQYPPQQPGQYPPQQPPQQQQQYPPQQPGQYPPQQPPQQQYPQQTPQQPQSAPEQPPQEEEQVF
ncbi:MAG: hypothetical protein QCI38_01415 [Candidatus Thermoplasmatota archaeon]|nr:hypothetical protein [Candidatus Thermoplasmatota archaeon]